MKEVIIEKLLWDHIYNFFFWNVYLSSTMATAPSRPAPQPARAAPPPSTPAPVAAQPSAVGAPAASSG